MQSRPAYRPPLPLPKVGVGGEKVPTLCLGCPLSSFLGLSLYLSYAYGSLALLQMVLPTQWVP
jgi:hypothetical protein